MEPVYEQLIWLGRELGARGARFVEGPGACVSARLDADTFAINRVGASLPGLAREDLLTCRLQDAASLIDLQFLRPVELLAELAATRVGGDVGQPVLDSDLHAWLLRQEGVGFVAQARPTACLQVLCSASAEKFADNRMFPEEIAACGARSAYAAFAEPGVAQAREVRTRVTLFMRQNQGHLPRVILVQSCGVLTLGATAGEALDAMLMVEKAAEVLVGTSRLGGVVFMPQHVARRVAFEMGINTGPALDRTARGKEA